MIGNLWLAALAFVLGAGLTYLRMAGKATRQVAKPVPHRLVMGGIIPGLVDPLADPSPTGVGPQWAIRVCSPTTPEPEIPAAESDGASAADASAPDLAGEAVPKVQPLEPPWPIEDEHLQTEPESVVAAPQEPDAPAAAAPTEPASSAWWAAAFDRGDPGPYPGTLRYPNAQPPAGSRILDVDDEFATVLGAGAAASAASAALFGTFGSHTAEPASPIAEVGYAPAADAAAQPEDELIKGNRDSMLYHTPDSPWYGRTTAEEWFQTEQEAQAAGYQRWNSRLDDGGN